MSSRRFRPLGDDLPEKPVPISRRKKVSAELDDPAGWRIKIQTRNKFTDEDKAIVIQEFSKHGCLSRAARKAGVGPGMIERAINESENNKWYDPIFAQAMYEAELKYKEKLMMHFQDLIFEGQVHESYDKDGNIRSRKHTYPTDLIKMEMQRQFPEYKNTKKVDVDMNVRGGVLVAPAEAGSVDEWNNRYKK